MKIRRREGGTPDKVQLEMTPMIDVVFQLLTFFIFTFRVVPIEGDFEVRMPAAAATTNLEQPTTETLKIRMRATEGGELASLTIDGSPVDGSQRSVFEELHLRIRRDYTDDQGGPNTKVKDTEAQFECDYNLKYANVIKAIDAISGYKTGSGDDAKIVRLVEKIKFAQPAGKK